MKRVTLLTRPGCHLCAAARAVVEAVTIDTGSPLAELNVDDDRELREEYGDMVPVVLVDDVPHGYFHIDPVHLRDALR